MALTAAHHQWIRDASNGTFDPEMPARATVNGDAGNLPAGLSLPAVAEVSGNGGAGPAGELDGRKQELRIAGDMWIATERRIRGDVGHLGTAILQEYAGDENASRMEAEFEQHVTNVFQTFDGDLETALYAAAQSKSTAELDGKLAHVRDLVREYSDFVGADHLLSAMDDNPYVALAIVAQCRRTLDDIVERIG